MSPTSELYYDEGGILIFRADLPRRPRKDRPMTRRMSCSMTIEQVERQEKTETRRHEDTWRDLKPGDRLTLIDKGMGLKKGEKQRVLAEVVVTDVRVEPLYDIDEDGCTAEGFPNLTPGEFCKMWMDSHGYASVRTQNDAMAIRCRRIEWRYLP